MTTPQASAHEGTILPRYKSHKTVRAVRIERFATTEDGGGMIEPRGSGPHVRVSAEWAKRTYMAIQQAAALRGTPKLDIGDGYYVRYEDGYESWSPADTFEKGYAPIGEPEPPIEARVALLESQVQLLDRLCARVIEREVEEEHRDGVEEEHRHGVERAPVQVGSFTSDAGGKDGLYQTYETEVQPRARNGNERAFQHRFITDRDGRPAGGRDRGAGFDVRWQSGPVYHGIRKGAFIEEVLEACLCRLHDFQQGKFACRENGEAIEHIKSAILALFHRTASRKARGVEGTHQT